MNAKKIIKISIFGIIIAFVLALIPSFIELKKQILEANSLPSKQGIQEPQDPVP